MVQPPKMKKVMNSEVTGIYVRDESLRRLCTAIQMSFGVPEVDAKVVTDCLVEANLMGLDTHGVLRLKFYMDRIKAGGNNPRPKISAVYERACTALLDADNALGPVGGKQAMDLAIEKALVNGIGIVVIRNCNHYGPAGYYARMALTHDMIGISLTNVLSSMPPTGGRKPCLGNNAYGIAFPANKEQPVVVDGATSMASWGKLFLCAQMGENLPDGCYLDSEGMPTVKAQDVLDGGVLLPFAGYKGYGIAAAIELLTGMLADAQLDHNIPHPYKKLNEPGANTFFMSALRIDHFTQPERFKQRMDQWIHFIRNTYKSPGVERIWLPGEKEAMTHIHRLANGIPLSVQMVEELKSLAKESNVRFQLETMQTKLE